MSQTPVAAGAADIVVITQPEAGVRVGRSGVTSVVRDVDVRPLAAALSADSVTVQPAFGRSEDRLQAMAGTVVPEVDLEIPDLSVFYEVRTSDPAHVEELLQSLRDSELVDAAYVRPQPYPATVLINDQGPLLVAPPAVTPDFIGRQGYLEAAPAGVNARYAWTLPGGGGDGVRIIDLEGAWRFSHEDLGQGQGGVASGPESAELAWRNHGTAVLGVMSADRGPRGVTGVCPEAHVRAVSIFGPGGIAGAVRRATDLLGRGDLILLEVQNPGPVNGYTATPAMPVGFISPEWWEDVFQAIRYAVAHGVIVVEAAGNGSQDLDADVYDIAGPGFPAAWTNPFDRTNRDSGAILVGAGAPPGGSGGPDRSRLDFSNYGSMVDVQGWGGEVAATGYGDLQGGTDEDEWYTSQFSGTSSATPVVAGALACVQGTRRARVNEVHLTPGSARQLLRASGSPQQDAPGRPATQRIGNRPDLGRLLPGPVIYSIGHTRVRAVGPATSADLTWYRHLGRRTGNGAWEGPHRLNGGWDRRRAFSGGDGVVYTIEKNGDLWWRRHDGRSDGTDRWATPRKIGNGWNFAHVFSPGRGSIYAVLGAGGKGPATGRSTTGDMLRYQHLGHADGSPGWAGPPQHVGTGWDFPHVFSGGGSTVHAVTTGGDLLWYRHSQSGGNVQDWDGGGVVGHGWDFEHVFYGGPGPNSDLDESILYAITRSGDLLWYHFGGNAAGTDTWLSAPTTVGHGWDVREVFVG